MSKQHHHARPVNLALAPMQEATLEAIGGFRGVRWRGDNSAMRGVPESLLAVLVFQDGRGQEVEVDKGGGSVKERAPFGADFLTHLDELVRWGCVERRDEVDAHPGSTPGYLLGDLDIEVEPTEMEPDRWDLGVFVNSRWAFMLRYGARSREEVPGRTCMLTERGREFLKGTEGNAKAEGKRRSRDERNEELRVLLREGGDLTRKRAATLLGCSEGAVSNLPSWKALMEKRLRTGKPKTPLAMSISDKMEFADLSQFTPEQEAERRETGHGHENPEDAPRHYFSQRRPA